jgi:VanZ family protein
VLILKYLLTTLSTLLILVAVMLPGSKVPDVGIIGIDKAAHFALFAAWVISLRHDFDQRFKWGWAFGVGLAFSVLTEVVQIRVDGRAADWMDVVWDTVGLLFGIVFGTMLLSWFARFIPWLSPGYRSGK